MSSKVLVKTTTRSSNGEGEVLGNEVAEVVEGELVEVAKEAQPVNYLPSPYMPTQYERDDTTLRMPFTGVGAGIPSRAEVLI